MRFYKTILVLFLLAGAPMVGPGAESAGPQPAAEATAHAAAAKPEEHGLSPKALSIGKSENSLISSSMVVTWVVALGLIVFARLATRKMQLAPTGAQNFWEWLVESLYEFLEGIIGPELVKKTFWFFAHGVHLHPVHELVWAPPGGRHHRLGRADARKGSTFDQPAAARRQRRPEHDPRHGDDLLRAAGSSGPCKPSASKASFWICSVPRATPPGLLKILDDRGVLPGRLPGGALHHVPADLAELSSLRQHLCRREHARVDGQAGARLWAGCCRCRSISWSCWWGWCRRWCSCC